MTEATNPYSAGGGGWVFQTLVATHYAADLLCASQCDLGGFVERLEQQTDTDAFDDIRLHFEPSDGDQTLRQVDLQCRIRQPFGGKDAKFCGLLGAAVGLVSSDDAFARGQRGLAIIVGPRSPAHLDLRHLCDLARAEDGLDAFLGAIARRQGALARRWEHAQNAAGYDVDQGVLYQVLRALHVRALDIEDRSSRDRHLLHARLASLWTPPDVAQGEALFNSLYFGLSQLGRDAGSVDRRQLVARLGRAAPPPPQRETRQERLLTMMDASEYRARGALMALGVSESLAAEVSRDALDAPFEVTTRSSITLVTGSMGVGKSTELERRHRAALRVALNDVSAPIPIHFRAQRLQAESLESIVASEAAGLGDPRRCGVYLTVDGLDEAGLEIESLLPDFNTLLAKMPGSSIMATARVAPAGYRGEVSDVPPLAEARARDLIAKLRLDGFAHIYGRNERMDLLTRPLFAIQYALGGSDRSHQPTTEAKFIAGIGKRVAEDLKIETFATLVALAVKQVDSGGAPVRPGELNLAPPHIGDLVRSRLVSYDGDGLTLQLAVLVEWFAGHAIHSEQPLLAHTTSTPVLAWRWRYVHAQALLQANADQADRLMGHLVASSPGTAAWVLNEARDESLFEAQRGNPQPVEQLRRRLLLADAAWFGAIPAINSSEHLASPNVASTIFMDDDGLVVATRLEGSPAEPLVEASTPPTAGDPWTTVRYRDVTADAKWPWEWTFDWAQDALKRRLEAGAGLEALPSAAPELAYAYALTVVGANWLSATEGVDVERLKEKVQTYRDRYPRDNVRVVEGGRSWDLSVAEGFLKAALHDGRRTIESPWPSADRRGGSTWLWFSPEQLQRRLAAFTLGALNIYQQFVDDLLPGLRPLLATYALLPGRVVGTLTPAVADEGWAGQPRLSWAIEPLPVGEANSSEWTLVESDETRPFDTAAWKEKLQEFRALRGANSELMAYSIYGGLPDAYDERPASHLALRLLVADLTRIAWCRAVVRTDEFPQFPPISMGAIP